MDLNYLRKSRIYRWIGATGIVAVFLFVQLFGQFIPFLGSNVFLDNNFFQDSFQAQEVHAQTDRANPDDTGSDDPSAANTVKTDLLQTLEYVTKGVYLLLWPSLAVSGAALSNDLVYGKAFKLDVSLWKFWQMMRTFANFVLGFLFVGSILYAFFRQKRDKQWVAKLFKRTVLAGVLINMSWGIMAALIDLSTIGVVAIGGLPINVFDGGEENVLDEVRFLKSHSFIDLQPSDDEEADILSQAIVYSCGDKGSGDDVKPPDSYYAPCLIESGEFIKEGSVGEKSTWANYLEDVKKAWKKFESDSGEESEINVSGKLNPDFCVYGGDLLEYESEGSIASCKDFEDSLKAGNKRMEDEDCPLLSDIPKRATESTGPLYTLYSSIFLMAEVGMTTNFGSITEVSMEMMMKALIGIGLLIPLIILAVVLVIRVVFLWLIIIFSPLLILAYVFDFKQAKEVWNQKFTLGNVISLIFLPVFAVFALSISLVFMSLLSNITLIEKEYGKAEEAVSQPSECLNNSVTAAGAATNITEIDNPENQTCYDFMGIQVVCFSEGDRVFGSNIVNILSRLVLNFFGIALMWMVVMFVLQSNKITKSIATDAENLAKQGLKTLPVIPVGDGMSIGGVERFKDRIDTKIDQYARQQFDKQGWDSFMNNRQNVGSEEHEKHVKSLKGNPGSFFDGSWEPMNHTHIRNYDDATQSIVDHANQKIEQYNKGKDEADQVDKIKAENMTQLTSSKKFWDYIDKVEENGDTFTKSFISQKDKTSDQKFNMKTSGDFKSGLKASADDAEGGYHIELTNDADKVERDFIYANGKLKTFIWERVPGGTGRRIAENSVEVYNLAPEGINSAQEFDRFSGLIDSLGGYMNLPTGLKEKYIHTAGEKSDSIADQIGDSDVSGEVELTLGDNEVTVRVVQEDGEIKSIERADRPETPDD